MAGARVLRIALIGAGTIAQDVAKALLSGAIPGLDLVAVFTRTTRSTIVGVPRVASLAELLALKADLIVECAGADAFEEYVPQLLASGSTVIAVSMAAMARAQVTEKIAALRSGRLLFASGAVGGLDALTAAREGGLERVDVIQRKPPAALLSPEAASQLKQAQVIQQSSARAVALALPANSNVAAAVALAGLGFDRTTVTVIADPEVTRNTVEVEAQGKFGSFRLVIANHPSPGNPKTSMTPAMSVLAALRRQTGMICIPA